MKSMNTILKNKDLTKSRDNYNYQEPFVSPNLNQETANIVNQLFEKMEVIFSGFKHTWPTDNEVSRAKKEWVLALIDSDIHEIERINKGLSQLRLLDKDFPPSPGQFIKLCQDPIKPIKHQSDTRDMTYMSLPRPPKNENARTIEMNKIKEMLNLKQFSHEIL